MANAEQPVRVAIVGGGCAALTTAFELTDPALDGRYDVTVYQMGWRLGGKGASGRGPSNRIEEHGLHLWLGFYENAFRLMRDCYAELDADETRRIRRWDQAFSPAPDVAVTDRTASGDWDVWLAHFPPGRGLPGDASRGFGPTTVVEYMNRCAFLVGELLRSAQDGDGRLGRDVAAEADEGEEPVAGRLERLLQFGQLAGFAALLEASHLLRQMYDFSVPPPMRGYPGSPVRLIEAMSRGARAQLDKLVEADDDIRRIWHVIDIILAALRGATVHRLALDPRGFDAINEYDWREWLIMHGASEQSVHSGFMNGIYDLVFAFEEGDITRPRMAAGVAMRGAVRMFFTYRGSLFWRMNAGMGDIVFAPLYEVLKQRGAKFEFFHRLVDMDVSPEEEGVTPHVTALHFDVQAEIKGGREYKPLVNVHDVSCWPSEPVYSQLVDGVRLREEGRAFEGHWETRKAGAKKLEVSEDFDFVVLGVSVGSLPHVASQLIEREPVWQDMVEHVKTVPTQAFQLWLRHDMSQLGWPHPPINLSGFVQPFDTWADMEHLIREEGWKDDVRAIAYFCSVLPDPMVDGGEVTEELYREQREVVRGNAVNFLDTHIGALWPNAMAPAGGFRWELLAEEKRRARKKADDASDSGRGRFGTQFWTANVNPSDRYVLSLPGSIRYRVSPLDVHFDNLTVAGDWTRSGLDSGCIESAVMSGRVAAHALSGSPSLDDIAGYDHP